MEKVSGTSRTASLDENPAPKLWKESWRVSVSLFQSFIIMASGLIRSQTIARNPQEFSRKPKETMVQLLDVLGKCPMFALQFFVRRHVPLFINH